MSVLRYPNLRQIFYDYGTANSLTDRLLQPWRVRETNGAGAILAEYSLTGGGSGQPQPLSSAPDSATGWSAAREQSADSGRI